MSIELTEAVAALSAAADALADARVDTAHHDELLSALEVVEKVRRRLPVTEHRVITRLTGETTPSQLGARTIRDVLVLRLRVSRAEAGRRIADAERLGARTTLSGEALPPRLPAVAAAQADGTLGAESVAVVGRFVELLPRWVDPATAETAEASLVEVAVAHGPDVARRAAQRLAMLIDQDGPEPRDTPARHRGLWFGRQFPDGTSEVRGVITAELRAYLQTIAAKWAAPGMCHPADDPPHTSGTPSAEQIQADERSHGARMHDAWLAVARQALTSGVLGQHRGLPVTVVATATVEDLQTAAGVATTADGTLLPMPELIRMAARAWHYLAVFDGSTGAALHLGRGRRLAEPAQRLVLLARDGGCTAPGCTVPASGTQVHHATSWAAGGGTDVDDMMLACPVHNREAEHGFTTTVENGIATWVPPPALDHGQPRTNPLHHPERLTPRSRRGPRDARPRAGPSG